MKVLQALGVALVFLVSHGESFPQKPTQLGTCRASKRYATSLAASASRNASKKLSLYEGKLHDIIQSCGSDDGVSVQDLWYHIHPILKGHSNFKKNYGMSFTDWLKSIPHIVSIQQDRVTPAGSQSRGSTKEIVELRPKTAHQKNLVEALHSSTPYVIVEGPAGTGKTSLACHHVANLKMQNLIDRIIITRPTITAGEELGFLPGTLEEKLHPFLMPIFDCFTEFGLNVPDLMENGKIEVVPLAFMRGRTFKNCFLIADEMQNATPMQMKMLLTRLGENSRMVITGDLEQSDLSGGRERSGLSDIIHKVNPEVQSKFMKIVEFDDSDVLRHESMEWLLKTVYGKV
mmetsp:Transcript_25681/g.26087  ORF Transcript_25681/g.26087 Transcript_25681/m.26087 type:complete len:345 (-) Transcript_25681:417-1451(-)|eukprot:CAMPEP_0171297652 /NCGR_PEP_ID=MMETSP0816-20121228/6397_1 /TAXON_ID=420281 /ORGANISM="Proboscia inermis, Strain CCAP1064/1" /LENGTH=344 /DNA_ID=CAMNT_0011772077 /DNA_START=56 /DNA_END=1090 /DNA_ORIENTATION=+